MRLLIHPHFDDFGLKNTYRVICTRLKHRCCGYPYKAPTSSVLSVYTAFLLYCDVLIPRIIPKKVSSAIHVPTTCSPLGNPQIPANAKYKVPDAGSKYCVTHFIILYVLSLKTILSPILLID